MKIDDVFNADFVKIIIFLEQYEEELFTQQTLINKKVKYYKKISYFIEIFDKLGIIENVKMTGLGKIKLYRFNKNSVSYNQIKKLMRYIKEKEMFSNDIDEEFEKY